MKHATLMFATALLASVTAFGAMAQTSAPSTTPAPQAATPAPTAPMTTHKGMAMSRTRVEAIQTALKNNGEDVAPDGVWGPKTVAALRDFQKQHGLKTTGHMDRATALKLNLPPHSA